MSGNSGKGKAQRAKRAKASRATASHHAPRASKRAFQTLAVNIPGMVYRVHLREKNRMEFFNEMVEHMTGYRVAELLEGEVCSIDPLIVPEDRFRVLEILRDSIKENKPFEVEYRLSHKNGSTRTFLERGRPIYGHDGQPQFIDGVIMDITERKRAEEATKESEKKAWEQAARLQATLDAAPVIIWTAHDRDCRVISGNRAARELSQVDETVNMSKTGPEPERLAHYRILEDGRELAPEEMPIQIVAKSGKERREYSFSFVLGNGIEHSLFGNITPLLDADGKPNGAVAAFMDITDRKRAEGEVRELSQRLTYHVENSPLAVIEWGPDMRLIRWSCEAERIFGWRADEVVGKRMEDFRWVYEEDETQVAEVSSELVSGTNPQRFSANRNYRKDGSVIHCEWYNSSLVDDSGKLRSILSLVLDVTERNRMEEELRKSRDQLEVRVQERTAELETYMKRLQESNRQLEDFAFIASHDLQEPLRKIRTFGSLIESKSGHILPEQSRDYLDRMQKAAERMQELLRSLLDYSRVTTKAVAFEETDLNQSVEAALSNLEILIQEKNGKVEVEKLPSLEADRSQMTLLFQNLIGNALKFHGKDGTPLIKVYARPVVEGEEVKAYRIFVEDNGIGFNEKYLDKVFSPFQRLHGRSEYEGVGMGMPICKKILERHGGEITAKSELGKGSTFIVTLPSRQRRR
jgi:PAS domain S-box-containing protein